MNSWFKNIKVSIMVLSVSTFVLVTNSFSANNAPSVRPSDSAAFTPKPTQVAPYDVTISLAPSNTSAESGDNHCRGERLSDYQEHYVMEGNMYYFPSSSVGGSGITIPYDGTYQITAVVYLCKNEWRNFNKEVDLFQNLRVKPDSYGNVMYFEPQRILRAAVIYLNGPASWTYHNSSMSVNATLKKGDILWLGIGPTQEGTGDAVFTGGNIQITRVR